MHSYYYSGNQLAAEEWENNLVVFLYDANGAPTGLAYRNSSYTSGNWDNYWYERNLQGDVVAIYDNSNTKLVSYTYDAWGNHSVTYHNGGNNITAIVNNPIRYRGYYYDIDLGLYYLQSRYYDSNTCRFLNADGYISTGTGLLGYNMYAYCNNNPVMYVDPSGNIAVALSSGALSYGALKLFAVAFLFVVTMFAIDTSDAPKSITKSHSKSKVESKTEAEEETVTTTPPSEGMTYYHITTSESATAIMNSGMMSGSSAEGGYVFAWKAIPDNKAIKNSGAHGHVIISFTTTAAFERDPAFDYDSSAYKYGPVRTVFPGPIRVKNIKIVGTTK